MPVPFTRSLRLMTLGLAALALVALGTTAARELDTLRPGDTVADFTLKDVEGANRSLQSVLEGSRFVVVDFWSTRCPVSRRYEDRLKSIAEDYAGEGVRVLAIMSNQTEDAEDVRKYLEKTPLPYTLLIDPSSEIADRFGAETTPHIFVLDPTGRVVYTGGIDNGSTKPSKLRPHLREALDALLAGGTPPEPVTRHFGCSIKRKGKA